MKNEDAGLEDSNRTAELNERDAWLDLFEAAPDQVREELKLASSTIAGMGLLACRTVPITEFNRAMSVGTPSIPSRDDLEMVVSWLDAHAVSWALQIAPDAETAEMDAFLSEYRLEKTGAGWAKFVSTGAAHPDPIDSVAEIETVTEQGASVFGKTVTEGFGLPAICGMWFAALVERPSWRCFVATVDGEIAGGGAMFVRDGAAWFGIEATLPAYRQRGVQRRIIAAQIGAASASGAKVLGCETGLPPNGDEPGFASYRNQKRAGLAHAYTRPNYKRSG